MSINLLALEDGLVVLCVGFFVVFMFLTVLIFAMMIMAKVIGFINKVFPPVAPAAAPVRVSGSSDDEIALAIAVAIMKQNHK